MSSDLTTDYDRITDATWHILNATAERRAEILERVPPAYRDIVAAGTTGPGFDMEQARRRKTMGNVLGTTFPVTFFAYYGRTGAEGLHAFLDSEQWQQRPAQPGSVFPPAATTSAAFAAYLRDIGWTATQEDWVGEAFAFESDHLFGGSVAVPRSGVRLRAGAWVAEASFDVPEYGRLLRERGAVDPWPEALLLVKRRPCPLAVVSLPEAGRVRRFQLRGDTVAELRWLWDPAEEAPADATAGAAYARACASGLVDGAGE
ncbi:hypothetical protein [Streptomyces pristinaespiralis]|uniref:hypothetical protein n=1 Tax=Streptomyces pristinaespiralis TaxID=38300 RepID=UPI0038335485